MILNILQYIVVILVLLILLQFASLSRALINAVSLILDTILSLIRLIGAFAAALWQLAAYQPAADHTQHEPDVIFRDVWAVLGTLIKTGFSIILFAGDILLVRVLDFIRGSAVPVAMDTYRILHEQAAPVPEGALQSEGRVVQCAYLTQHGQCRRTQYVYDHYGEWYCFQHS